mgnify:CR=1 FL=1
MQLKKITSVCAVAALVLFVTACRKEEPKPDIGNPVFYVNGTLNGSPLLLRAGVNNYYMYSDYSSDQQNIYTFSGTLKTDGSSDPSPGSLKISISDSRASAPAPALIDSALFPGTYFFSQTQTSPLTMQFTSQAAGDTILGYNWDFGDSNFSTQANPIHTYATSGIYNVSLRTAFIHNNVFQEDTITSMINAGNTGQPISSFTGFNTFSNTFAFQAFTAGGTSPYSYIWNFGDNSFGTGDSVNHTYQSPPPDGICKVTLTTTDANNDSSITQKNILMPNATGCYCNFTAQALTGGNMFSNVTVTWTDAAGITYSSANGVGLNNSFQIISVDEYAPNENGQRTKKVRMLVTCTLFNGSSSIQLDNAEIVFALAYP